MTESFPPTNRLVCVASSSPSANLIVCFNGYGNRAFAQPDQPFSTRLEAFKLLEHYEAHVVWFAEEASSWYLEHEARMLDLLFDYIVDNKITSVKLIGSSAGGYAALRKGLLVDRKLGAAGLDVVLLSFAINPQTGFRADLIDRARQAVAARRWDAQDLGKNPILLSAAYMAAYQHLAIDFIELAGTSAPSNFAAVLLSDDLNPIDKAFSDDVVALPFILQLPQQLGLAHAAGCGKIWRGEIFWNAFDTVVPFEKREPVERELRSLV